MKVLVTGGTGFIGSHTCVELLNAGYDVVIADNLYNSKALVVDRIEKITGRRPAFYELDVNDRAALTDLFDKEDIDAVIHFAGYKAVGESTRMPLEYYANNIGSTLVLCDVMRAHGCKKIVFSSSATVYGDPAQIPITEDAHGEVTSEVPVAGTTFLGLAVHPYALKMAVCHAAQVMVARAEQVGCLGSVVLSFNLGSEINALLCGYGFLGIAGITIPDDT